MKLAEKYQQLTSSLSPKQRQYVNIGLIAVVGFGTLWALFALSEPATKAKPAPVNASAGVTNIGAMVPGSQVSPQDVWVGTAGRKLAQYEQERQDQDRLNADRKSFEDTITRRLSDLESKLSSPVMPPGVPPIAPLAPSVPALPNQGIPAGTPPVIMDPPREEPVGLLHVSLGSNPASATPTPPRDLGANVESFLPVGFVRAELLGGLDAPTGGQAQSNPHPVLLRLADTAVLPNRARGKIKECFVIGAGYGDISSERAFIRTESLSCVRTDGSVLEVKVQGSVFGEDGKAGMRGRVVTKQGQMLANALLAGIVGGIGQGFANSGTTVTTSALGSVATSQGDTREQMRRGIGTGTGRALDQLAQYYIKLAEQTFPVIEIDAGRQVDIVITKGVNLESPSTTSTSAPSEDKAPQLVPGGGNVQD
ncbi:conjugal transfer protein TraB [Massilia arenosa]|uniref:Conjugal transfer protein TraB n=1 Tax=Zemynaea arenosa TaxID=2561931 RepID=A0A4Y9RWW5_9BURK|nr:TraB/VirB10 family protein [Massilia arenosa]TFW13383.1 conjugal transfer protein TraB [Massilia arenosa]